MDQRDVKVVVDGAEVTEATGVAASGLAVEPDVVPYVVWNSDER